MTEFLEDGIHQVMMMMRNDHGAIHVLLREKYPDLEQRTFAGVAKVPVSQHENPVGSSRDPEDIFSLKSASCSISYIL